MSVASYQVVCTHSTALLRRASDGVYSLQLLHHASLQSASSLLDARSHSTNSSSSSSSSHDDDHVTDATKELRCRTKNVDFALREVFLGSTTAIIREVVDLPSRKPLNVETKADRRRTFVFSKRSKASSNYDASACSRGHARACAKRKKSFLQATGSSVV